MEYTTNKKYKKPDLLDKVSVQEYNENFDAMDANMAELEEKTNTAVKNASDALKQIEAAGGKVMTSDTLGVGKVDGKTVGVTGDGTLSVIAKAKDIPAEDTSSILGDSSSPTTQALIDAIANKVVNELVTNTALTSTLANYMTKSLMSSQNADNTDMVPTLALTNAMQKSIDTLNSKITETISENLKATQIGNVVIINGYCSGTFTDQKTTIGKLSKVGLPNIFVRTLCNIGSDAYSAQRQGYLYVNDNNGEVAVTSKSGEAGSNVYVSCSYVVK